MKLRLTGIKASGLRCAELDLRLGEEASTKFTFIQMPNGTGKTTIAECLRAVLSGEASGWNEARIASFKRDSDSSSGIFEARFTLDGAPLAVGIKFDFVDEMVSYYTTYSRTGGYIPKFNLPAQLARFADSSFVRLYIFDAELPQELLAEGSNRAEGAIEAFYQLYVLRQISDGLQSYWDNEVKGGVSTPQWLTRKQNELDGLRTEHRKLKGILQRNQRDIQKIRADIGEKSEQLETHLEQVQHYREEKEHLEDARDHANVKLRDELEAAVERLQRPLDAHPGLRSALDLVAAGLDSLKLPESTSREFFRELIQQSECICGAPMTDDAKSHISRIAEELLADDTAGVLNALKNDVRSFSRDDVNFPLSVLAESISETIRDRDKIEHDLQMLISEASEKADETAKQLKGEIDILRSKEARIGALIIDLTRDAWPTDDARGMCIAWFEQEIDKLEQVVAEARNVVELRERKDALQRMLDGSASRAREGARRELVDAMNERLGALLPGENLRVADIRPSLILEGREGVNLGAMLSIGYSFLTTLFERGNHQFPFIVDAPTMGLDGLAREALAEILPRATHQFVGFVLDNERDFVRYIDAAAHGECEFYTVFSDSSRNKPLATQVPAGIEPGDGGTYVITGFDFFDKVMWTSIGE